METMDDLKKELDESYKRLEEGDVMSGKVENEDQAELNLAWTKVQELKNSGEAINVKVGGVVNGGLIAYIDNLRGFIPASQISLSFVENLDEWLGKDLKVKVITVDAGRKKLVLSAKALLKEAEKKAKDEKLSALKPGTVKEGTVETIQPYGAFVNIGDGLTGLLHVSQISDKRIKTPGEVLKEGQTVTVKVLNIKDGKISLSMKALNDNAEAEAADEEIEIPETAPVTTSLGDLLKGFNL
ncbi:small subunit ribosomal protein S1 [Lachnospiraceae bacterium]|nr:small subunit ribosomal protein S1 [Lachnospiraceae bacterium]